MLGHTDKKAYINKGSIPATKYFYWTKNIASYFSNSFAYFNIICAPTM